MAHSPYDNEHKLGALLDYFLMPENTGVSLEDIISRVVVENVDELEGCLAKGKKVLKEATKALAKLLTRVVKHKMAQEKSHPTKAAHKDATEVLCQATEQLDRVRSTIAHHTVEIAYIEAVLKDCESMEEESSSSKEGSPPRSGSKDSPTATPQGYDDGHNIEMEDIGNTSNPSQGTATRTDPPEDNLEDAVDDPDVIVEDEWIVVEGEALLPSHQRMIDSWTWMTRKVELQPKPPPER